MNPEKLKQLQEQVRIGGKVSKHLCYIFICLNKGVTGILDRMFYR